MVTAALAPAPLRAESTPDPADRRFLAAQLVDEMNHLFGAHPGARASHAKGELYTGTFKPSKRAAALSKAPHLQGAPIPVVVRFSASTGLPRIADASPLANPRGMAVKFTLPNGAETDVVAHSLNGFPAATATDFRELLAASAQSGPDARKPTALDKYLADHPTAKAMLAPQPIPQSYATLPYYGVNAFKFTNAKGGVVFGRYRLVPLAGARYLSSTEASKAGPDFLSDELRRRLRRSPVKFKLLLQLAAPTDDLNDPSHPWPEDRRLVELGTITIARSFDNAAAAKTIVFLPGAVAPGIDPQDPMINARSNAYVVSFERRQ